MKRFLICVFIVGILSACSHIDSDCVAICGGKEVLIVDMDKSGNGFPHVVWSWSVDDPESGLPEEYHKLLNPLDECKFVDGNRKLLVTSSRCAVALLDIKTRKASFYAKTRMAHSAEMLPGGRIAVALSINKNGNALELYDSEKPEVLLYKDSLYSGHGVVWNEKRQRLYALGYSELREYKLVDWETESPSLERVCTWKIPVVSGHDLSPVGKDHFLVTGAEGVCMFSLDDGTFTPFEPLEKVAHVKSVNYRESDGRIIYTKAEESWWTHNVYQLNPDKHITLDSLDIYKVRPAW